MKKGTKVAIVVGLVLCLLISVFVFWFSTLPKAEEVVTPKKFINSQESSEQKTEIDGTIQKNTNDFVATFFLFDKQKIEKYTSIQGVSTDTENYYEQYGEGSEIKYKVKQATQDEPTNLFITYEVSGKYKGIFHRFSIVINVGQTYSSVPTIQNYTVVLND